MILTFVTVIFALLGILGTFLPVLPGTPLIVVGGLIYAIGTHFTNLTVIDLIILAGMSFVAEGLEYFLSLFGAKKFGANKIGQIGGVVGFLLGIIFFAPLGILLGPFLGAFLAELITGCEPKQAIRVGMGSLIGVLGGMVMTFVISLVMTIWLFIRIL